MLRKASLCILWCSSIVSVLEGLGPVVSWQHDVSAEGLVPGSSRRWSPAECVGAAGASFEGYFVVWGGVSDQEVQSGAQQNEESLFVLNDQLQWVQPTQQGRIDRRIYHSVVGPFRFDGSTSGDGLFLVIGGQNASTMEYIQAERVVLNGFSLSADGLQANWTSLSLVNGSIVPSPRMGQAVASLQTNDGAYMFGGYYYDPVVHGTNRNHQIYYHDLYHLKQANESSTLTLEWTSPSTLVDVVLDERPSARYGHSFNAFDSFLVMFGGTRYNYAIPTEKQGNIEFLNEVWVLEAPDQDSLSTGTSLQWRFVNTSQTSTVEPIPRAGHSAIVHGNLLIIYGGYVIDRLNERHVQFLDDVWALDTTTWAWQQLSNGGTVPNGRSGHISGKLGTNRFVTVGGAIHYDIGQNTQQMTIVESQVFSFSLN